jgi:hypothetical protein
MLRYLAAIGGSTLTDTRLQRFMVVNWINTVSMQIERHLKRSLKIDSYTEYYDTRRESDTTFLVSAFPVLTLTDVYTDSEGLYDGAESEIEDCIINTRSSGFVLPYSPPVLGHKTIRVRYVGGLAYESVKSTYTCTIAGLWNVGSFALGGTSGAVGIVSAVTTTTLTIEILYGVFENGETLTEYTDENITALGDGTAVITAITQQSLIDQCPDIVRAAEMQVRYYWKHKDDFELESTNRDSTNRKTSEKRPTPLTDEVESILESYQRKII